MRVVIVVAAVEMAAVATAAVVMAAVVTGVVPAARVVGAGAAAEAKLVVAVECGEGGVGGGLAVGAHLYRLSLLPPSACPLASSLFERMLRL